MLSLDFSILFFISCVISCIFFTLGRFLGRIEERQDNTSSRKAKISPKRYGFDDYLQDNDVIDIMPHIENRESAIDLLSSFTLVYSKKDEKFVRVPREYAEVIRQIEKDI